MAWLDGFPGPKTARERAETAMYAPLGMMSPLWFAFGAAASAGAAFWLMSRWAKPVNIEAAMASVDTTAVQVTSTHSPVADPVVGSLVEMESVMADDLTKLAGVGPKIAQALAERGVERFEDLAAWTQDDLAAFDAALDLRGRAIRADFVTQARRLAAGQA
jgi:predicted flap endonuclease-1-like 5' DNA nuclease